MLLFEGYEQSNEKMRRIFGFAKECMADCVALPFYLNKTDMAIDEVNRCTLRYSNKQGIGEHKYRFSASAPIDTLFSGVFYLLICGLVGEKIEDSEGWYRYFDSFQDEDGVWRDNDYPFRSWLERDDEWNDIHLIAHIIYAYELIGKNPSKRFAFLDKFKDISYAKEFCDRINFEQFWGESNGVMNYLVSMIYARDVMGDKDLQPSISYIVSFLKQRADETDGLWTEKQDKSSLYEAVRGGYHVWMLMIQEGVEFTDKQIKIIIDTILSLQNRFGGFNKRIVADTCHNIDCIDPLVRFSLMRPEYRKQDVRESLLKARRYLLNNMNGDGGFCFRRMHKIRYGSDALVAGINESSMFGTWFTLLAIDVIEDFFSDTTILHSELPGIEYRVKAYTQ